MKRKRRISRHRFFLLVLAVLCVGMLFSGCGKTEGQDTEPVDNEKEKGFQIVCTIFPAYDWTRQILGDHADEVQLTLLLKNGSDLHSYQPTVWDMVKISEADLFIYVGGESDFWIEDALKNVKNPDQKTLNLMEVLKARIREEEHVEGMSHAHEHEHSEEEHEEEPEYDEHVWLSLKNASMVCEAIERHLSEGMPEYKEDYEKNLKEYQGKLEKLDIEYEETVKQTEKPVILVGDRFPFRYMAEDYQLTYYAAFSGCAADTEASFETITFLARKADELGLPAVLTIDGSDGKIARTIAANTGSKTQQVYCLNSMQSVSEQDIVDGENYISIMEENLEVLKKALP